MKLIISKNIVAASSSILLFTLSGIFAYLAHYFRQINIGSLQFFFAFIACLAPILLMGILPIIGDIEEKTIEFQLDITIPPKYKLQAEGEFTYIMVKDTLFGNYRQHSVYTDIDKALNAYNELLQN